MYRKSVYYVFIFVLLFSSITANSVNKINEDSLNYDVLNKVLITITEKKNVITLDVSQGIEIVKILSAKPLNGLDFRDFPSLIIKVKKDGFEKLNVKLMDFVKGKNKKKKTAYFSGEDFTFDNFTELIIIIEDTNLELKNFKIDFWLHLR